MKAGSSKAAKAAKAKDSKATQQDPPGTYRCPHCGELLSSPARNYECPKRPA